MIEVKGTVKPYSHFGPKDRAELIAAAKKSGFEPLLAWWPKYGQLEWIPREAWPSDDSN